MRREHAAAVLQEPCGTHLVCDHLRPAISSEDASCQAATAPEISLRILRRACRMQGASCQQDTSAVQQSKCLHATMPSTKS